MDTPDGEGVDIASAASIMLQKLSTKSSLFLLWPRYSETYRCQLEDASLPPEFVRTTGPYQQGKIQEDHGLILTEYRSSFYIFLIDLNDSTCYFT